MQLFKDANRMLAQWDGDFHTHVRFGLYPACSDGDDLLLTDPEQEGRTLRLACCANNTPRNRTNLIFAFRISYVRYRKTYPIPWEFSRLL